MVTRSGDGSAGDADYGSIGVSYSRYRRPGELELDEAFFPILWRDGYRSPWIDAYTAGAR